MLCYVVFLCWCCCNHVTKAQTLNVKARKISQRRLTTQTVMVYAR